MNALSIGISEEDFWEMNPHRVLLHVDGYNTRVKREFELFNVEAHLQGQYFVEALLCTVGNMFSKANSKTIEYPKDPYKFNSGDKVNEDELRKQRELFVASLMTKQANFELSKSKKESE